jgi:general secretion pathway protein H
MIELLVVLMLIAAVAAIVLPRIASGPTTGEIKSSARQIAAGLRLARSAAVTERRPVMLEIDTENRSFRIDTSARVHRLPDGLEIGLFTARRDVVSEKVGGIRFFPDGGSNGGRVTVGAGERRYSIDVDWLTGRVSIVD